jgi:NitT/TauT family transport system substrate-binding protein
MKPIRIQIFSLFILLVSQLAPGFCQTKVKLTIGYASMSTVATTLWVAQERGFFAKNGIDARTIFIPGSPTAIASLNAGEVQLGYTGGTATLGSAVGGLDIKMIASFSNKVQNDFVVRPEIKTATELRGKRVGVTSIGGTGWMSAMLVLEQLGLVPERDQISLAAFGDQRVITQALESGAIHGAAITGVFSRRLKGAGYRLLGEPEKLPIVGTGIVVKANFLSSERALVRDALKALMEGHAFLLNPANKHAVLEIIMKKLGIKDAEIAEDGLEEYVKRVDRKPYVSVEGLQNIQRFMKVRNPKIAAIKVEKLVDDSILRDLEKSGFIDQVYARSPASH